MSLKMFSKYKMLSELGEAKVLEQPTVAQYPGFPCAFRAVASLSPKVKDSYALLCGPEICLYNAKMHINIKSLTNHPTDNRLLFLPLKQNDIVFGIVNKIKNAVIEICNCIKPQVLFVVTTCVCEIIGDEIDSVIDEIQKETETKILIIHTDNFTSEDCAPGIEKVMLGLEKLMKPQKVISKSVNILGALMPHPEKTEMVEILKRNGIEVLNIIPSECTPLEIENAPRSSLNIVITHYGLPLAKKMKERFGTPYIYIEKSFSPDSIEKDYLKIADALNIDISKEVKELKENAISLINELKGKYKGKTCVLGLMCAIQMGRYFDLTSLLIHLGFEIKGLLLSQILPMDKNDIEILREKGIDPIVVRVGDYSVVENVLKELKPDCFFGEYDDNKAIVRLGIEPRSLRHCYHDLGFQSLYELLHDIQKEPPGLRALKYREILLKGE